MPREATLERARAEAAAGDLARARDRLLGLVATYPGDLALRAELGALYWRLGDRAMAGRYWYLEEPVDDSRRQAIAAFERRLGSDPAAIRRALKLRLASEIELTPHARAVLARLESTGAIASKPAGAPREAAGWRQTAMQFGCMLFLALVVVLAIVGLLSILS